LDRFLFSLLIVFKLSIINVIYPWYQPESNNQLEIKTPITVDLSSMKIFSKHNFKINKSAQNMLMPNMKPFLENNSKLNLIVGSFLKNNKSLNLVINNFHFTASHADQQEVTVSNYYQVIIGIMYIIGLIAGFFFMVYCFGHVNDEI
jgi:nucleoside recognition membrane protein YjiH